MYLGWYNKITNSGKGEAEFFSDRAYISFVSYDYSSNRIKK